MSRAITLSLREPLSQPLDVDGVTPDRCADLGEKDIASLPVWLGKQAACVGDMFHVRGERSSSMRVEGVSPLVHGLGAQMMRGELFIEGDAGHRVAAHMTGGAVELRGSAGDDAGMAMSGGTVIVAKDVGHRLAGPLPGASKGMTGGEIIVFGSAGDDAVARVRRGLVVVAGNAGRHTARSMIAGTLVVFGRTGSDAGRGSKRGSILAVGGIDVPSTYQYANTYRPAYVRLVLTYLRRRYGMTIDERVLGGLYRRYCGDAGVPGKGEILEWVGSSGNGS